MYKYVGIMHMKYISYIIFRYYLAGVSLLKPLLPLNTVIPQNVTYVTKEKHGSLFNTKLPVFTVFDSQYPEAVSVLQGCEVQMQLRKGTKAAANPIVPGSHESREFLHKQLLCGLNTCTSAPLVICQQAPYVRARTFSSSAT